MKLVFAGTPAFAVPTLAALHRAGHSIVAVYTQPDRPAGRGRRLTPSAVKEYALEHRLPVRQPPRLTGEEQVLGELAPDAMVVVAYGLLLPPPVLERPRYGCLNVHASLLPRWRGAAPIARAIEAGDTETGVTIMQMDRGLDTGPILLQRRIRLRDDDTTASLEPRLAALGAEAMLEALERLAQGALEPRAQDPVHACYAPKLDKAEAPLDWTQPAAVLHRKVRALNPWPVATARWNERVLRLWNVGPLMPSSVQAAAPGTVLAADARGLHVQTGDGVLTVTVLQAPGGRALPAAEFLRGARLRPGDRLA
ncbi:MAG TPA: methionyl-tRNA formyltransferase [Burkholderiales bacterium]